MFLEMMEVNVKQFKTNFAEMFFHLGNKFEFNDYLASKKPSLDE